MMYYSTNGKAPKADLRKVVVKGLAEDRGLYMPEPIRRLPESFFETLSQRFFVENSIKVAEAFFGEDVPQKDLSRIVEETLSFDCPIREVEPGIYALELFHGPTLAFKDVGARFMARLLQHFNDGVGDVNVLVATSGDTGSAVANGFLGVEGIKVFVLYPKGKVSPIQECQFTTLGQNITALEIDGTFDDCQALVKAAFMDAELNEKMRLTSANSINVARFLPQSFYYFWAYAQLQKLGKAKDVVCCVPSGNFGNICAALFGKRMGLPIKRFIAANNANSVFYEFLQIGSSEHREDDRLNGAEQQAEQRDDEPADADGNVRIVHEADKKLHSYQGHDSGNVAVRHLVEQDLVYDGHHQHGDGDGKACVIGDLLERTGQYADCDCRSHEYAEPQDDVE